MSVDTIIASFTQDQKRIPDLTSLFTVRQETDKKTYPKMLCLSVKCHSSNAISSFKPKAILPPYKLDFFFPLSIYIALIPL